MLYNRELRQEAQVRWEQARARSSSSSSNPEIVEAREELDESDEAYETMEEERSELWTK